METRRMCPQCRAFITTYDKVCPYCHEAVGPRAVDRNAPVKVFGGVLAQNQFTTMMLLLVNAGLFAVTVIYSRKFDNSEAILNLDRYTLKIFGAKFSEGIFFRGEWWRLITAGYLHGGLVHIAANSFSLYNLGPTVDEIFGISRYFVIYTVSTMAGFFLSAFWAPMDTSVGASAGIVGLVGALAAFGLRDKTSMGAAMREGAIRSVIGLFLMGFIPYFHIDNAAHFGGLVAGFGVAYFAGTPRISRTSSEQAWRIAAWACALLTVYCFVRMYLSFSMES